MAKTRARGRKTYTPEQREQWAQEREAKLKRLHGEIEDATARIATSDEWVAWLKVASTFHRYSWHNTLLIMVQRPDATRVAGVKTWNKIKRKIVKGSKGIMIFTPRPVFKKDESGRIIEPRVVDFMRFGIGHVFDVADTEGDEIPEQPRPTLLTGEAPEGLWESLVTIANDHDFIVTDDVPTVRDTANGEMDASAKVIRVHPGRDDAQRVKTLIHEIAHMILHRDEYSHRGIAEVEAESVAYLVTANHGLLSAGYTFPYVTGWADGKPEVVAATGERVMKTAHQILDVTKPE